MIDSLALAIHSKSRPYVKNIEKLSQGTLGRCMWQTPKSGCSFNKSCGWVLATGKGEEEPLTIKWCM